MVGLELLQLVSILVSLYGFVSTEYCNVTHGPKYCIICCSNVDSSEHNPIFVNINVSLKFQILFFAQMV